MNSTPVRLPHIEQERIGDELYLTNSAGDTLSVLNPTAMMIWSLCDGMHAPSDMAAILQEIYPVVKADALSEDIHGILQSFTEKQIIGPNHQDPPSPA